MVDLYTTRTYRPSSFEHLLSWFAHDNKRPVSHQPEALPHEGFSTSKPSFEQITRSTLAHHIIFREKKPSESSEEIPWEVRDVNGRRISSGKPITKKPIQGPEDPRVDWKKPEEIPELWIGRIITTVAIFIAGVTLFLGGVTLTPSPASTIGPVMPWKLPDDEVPLQS